MALREIFMKGIKDVSQYWDSWERVKRDKKLLLDFDNDTPGNFFLFCATNIRFSSNMLLKTIFIERRTLKYDPGKAAEKEMRLIRLLRTQFCLRLDLTKLHGAKFFL